MGSIFYVDFTARIMASCISLSCAKYIAVIEMPKTKTIYYIGTDLFPSCDV